MGKTKETPSFKYALFVMVATFATIMIPALAWGSRINALFLVSWIVAILLCLPTGTSYKELQAGLVANCSRAIIPAMIILCVGAMVGTWIAAGTVPVIISFGVRSISPQMFLATAFLLCATTAVVTGTSWGTFGTAGLAMAGVGASLGIDPMITAGAVCSGAFFGDTISPMSDSPNIASAVSGVDLFDGIKHQAKVTIPSALICLALYHWVGLRYRDGTIDMQLIDSVAGTIEGHFGTGLVTLLPAIFVIVLLAIKIPSIPSLLSGAICGGAVAWLYQGKTIHQCIDYLWSGYSVDTGVEFVDKLLNRGGVTSMTGTAVMFFFAFGLFGIFNAAGVVDVVVAPVTERLRTKLSLVASSIAMGVVGSIVGASMNFAYAFAGSIMAPIYEKRGLQKKNLMRALGVGCTAMAVLIPWSLSTIVAMPFLGVAAWQLIPYNFFLWVAPVLLLAWTALGWDTRWLSEVSEEERREEAGEEATE